MLKWEEKHDRAKQAIDHFLDNAAYWQEVEHLAEGLSEEEKEQVNEELAVMIASIRKRYKLDVRLPQKEEAKAELVAVAEPELVKEEAPAEVKTEEPQKPKRGRKPSTEKKEATEKKPRGRKKAEVA